MPPPTLTPSESASSEVPLARLVAKPFVGRGDLLEAAQIALARARQGRGGSLVFSGEPGIGKTHLADGLTKLAERDGFAVLSARCHELEGAPALWPWIQILRRAVEELPESLREADAGELGRLIEGGGLPDELISAASPDRFVVFDSIVRLLARVSSQRPSLVLIDDVHWADPASAMLLRYAIRELRESSILFVALFRHTDLVANHTLARALDGLAAESESFRLDGLGTPEIGELVSGIVGYELAEVFTAALQAHTGGNPLFMVEVMRLLISEDRLGSADAAVPDSIPLPASVRTTIERRLEVIDAASRGVLRQASLLGREFDRDVLEAAGIEAGTMRTAIEAGIGAALIESVDARGLRVRFAHDVVREVLADGLVGRERVDFHRRAAEALRSVHADRLEDFDAQLAAHFLAAAEGESDRVPGGAADAMAAHEYAVRAARRAYQSYSFEASAALLESSLRALDLAATATKDPSDTRLRLERRAQSLLRLADARWQSGQGEAASAADREAERIALRIGDPVLRARATLGLAGRNDLPLDPPAEHAESLRAAYADLPSEESVLRLRVLAQRVRSSSFGDLGVELVRWAEECARLAETIEDPWADFIARDAMHYALLPAEHLEARLEVSRTLPALARRLGSLRLEALATLWRIFDRLQVPDRAGAGRDANRLGEIAKRLRRPFWLWLSLGVDACFALMDGDFERAERRVHESLEVGRKASTPNAVLFFGTQLFHLRSAQGRADELLPIMEQIERERPGLPVFRIGIPLIHALAGRVEEARQSFDSVAAVDFRDVPDDFHRLPMLTSAARVAAFLGDAPRARVLLDLLAEHEGRIVMAGVVTFWAGPVDHALGLLRETLGDFEEADRLYAQGIALARRAGARIHEACALVDRARVRRRLGPERDASIDAELEHALAGFREALPPEAMTSIVAEPIGETLAGARSARGGSTPIGFQARFAPLDHTWVIEFGTDAIELPDSKGLAYLHQLLASPEQEIPALDLVALRDGGAPDVLAEGPADSVTTATLVESEFGAVDERAIMAYRRRLRSLAREREVARAHRDLARLEAIDEECARIEDELGRVAGLSNRPRPAPSSVERARKAVYNRIRASISRIGERAPELARHLERSITTGRTCAYRPERVIDWRLRAEE